ncbi:MAG: hypothetical protein SGPRY_002058 [Prymnesium sp.]
MRGPAPAGGATGAGGLRAARAGVAPEAAWLLTHPFPSLNDFASPVAASGGFGGAAVDSVATAGITLSQANEMHQGALELFLPQTFRDCDVTQWSACLARAGLPQAPAYFMQASGAASLERSAAAAWAKVLSAAASWQDAARNARALISGYTTLRLGRAGERQLAVQVDLLHGVTALETLRREHVRSSFFKNLTHSSHEERERELDAGVRCHLERRAQPWVELSFGKERASDAQILAEAQKLRLSVLTGVIAGDGPEAAVSGLARCMGRVLVALRSEDSDEAVLGASRDFDVQSNLLRIPHTMRSIARAPASESSPDIRAFAAEMGGAVLEKRLQDYEYERRSADYLAKMKEGFEERMRAIERRLPRGGVSPESWRPGDDQEWKSGRRAPRGEDTIVSKLDAVRVLQELVRRRLGLPVDRSSGKAEPCAWAALNGACTKKGCEACAGKLRVPEDLLMEVKRKCDERALRVKQPKKPG